MGNLPKYLREYLIAEDLTGYDKAIQLSYNKKLRDSMKSAIEDLTLMAIKENRFQYDQDSKKKIAEENTRNSLKELLDAFLTTDKKGYNKFIDDYDAFRRVEAFLEVINTAINRIWVHGQTVNVRLEDRSLSHYPWRNIRILQRMILLYDDFNEPGEEGLKKEKHNAKI